MIRFEVDADELAYQLAGSDSIEQADFFNLFNRHLKTRCNGQEKAKKQCQAIVNDLIESGEEFIQTMHKLIERRNMLIRTKKIIDKRVKNEY